MVAQKRETSARTGEGERGGREREKNEKNIITVFSCHYLQMKMLEFANLEKISN